MICTVARGFSMWFITKITKKCIKNGCRSSNLTMRLAQPQTVSIGCIYWAFFCTCNEDPTWIYTVSWSYMHPNTSSYITKQHKSSWLPDGVSMYVPCIGDLVCAGTHGLHMVIIFCMWGEATAWICTVSWSYMHSHVPCELRSQVPGSCAYGWL